MGRLAHLAATGRLERLIARARARQSRRLDLIGQRPTGIDDIDGSDGSDEEDEGPAGGQAELSIAVDSTGMHIVVGMNDTRGFGLNPISVSGYAYSDDGGLTFTDGGQLPVTTGTSTIGTTIFPQVFGDPEVKYVAWRRFPGGNNQSVGFARSIDNGATWSGPVNLTAAFFTMDQVLGNDRVNTSPSMAVDGSNGNIYVVYANNDNRDGADVAFQRSSDGGMTFSPAVIIDSRPGSDRAQWFPWVTVDKNTGRVYVFYYDQGIETSGDLTETTYQYSDSYGLTWSKPMPLTDRPFHAGYGNDTGQPNLGDYNQAVAQGGELFVVWAGNPNMVGFADGQPSSTSFTVPDVYFKRLSAPKAAVRLGAATFTDSNGNGFIDAGEQVSLKLPLENHVTNPAASSSAVSGIGGVLTSATPGVTVTQASSAYPMLLSGASALNAVDYVLQLSSGFVPGTHIELALNVSSSDGPTTLLKTLATGTPGKTILLAEDFDAVAPGALPAGWVTSHAGGNNTVPWTTNNTFNPGNNSAFHANANDGLSGNHVRFERLFSPMFVVPADSEYVTVDFDTKYDTEDDPDFNILAYDGFTLRVTDLTAGRMLRSNLVEAFAEEFTTGPLQHQPKHLPRSSNTNYFQDMSVWAGDSAGIQHVHLKLPGMSGSTAQLRFEFTQDSIFTCANVRAGHTCGVLFDNLVVNSVVSVQADVSISKAGSPQPVVSGNAITYTIVASNAAGNPLANTATSVTMSDTLPAGTTFVSSTAPAGWACATPPPGGTGTFSCQKPSMAPAETATFTLVVNVNCATPNGTIVTNTAMVSAAKPPIRIQPTTRRAG